MPEWKNVVSQKRRIWDVCKTCVVSKWVFGAVGSCVGSCGKWMRTFIEGMTGGCQGSSFSLLSGRTLCMSAGDQEAGERTV